MSAEDAAQGGAAQRGTGNALLAKRLDTLIKTVPRPQEEGGTLYSVPEVAEKIGTSKVNLYKILRGESTPGWTLVQRIADLFDVGLVYFEDSEKGSRYAEQMELLGALGLAGVTSAEFRGKPLSPRSAKLLANFAKQLQEYESEDSPDSDDHDVES